MESSDSIADLLSATIAIFILFFVLALLNPEKGDDEYHYTQINITNITEDYATIEYKIGDIDLYGSEVLFHVEDPFERVDSNSHLRAECDVFRTLVNKFDPALFNQREFNRYKSLLPCYDHVFNQNNEKIEPITNPYAEDIELLKYEVKEDQQTLTAAYIYKSYAYDPTNRSYEFDYSLLNQTINTRLFDDATITFWVDCKDVTTNELWYRADNLFSKIQIIQADQIIDLWIVCESAISDLTYPMGSEDIVRKVSNDLHQIKIEFSSGIPDTVIIESYSLLAPFKHKEIL